MAAAREGLSIQLEAFAATTAEYLRQERVLFLDGITVPQLRTALPGRPCVVVVRGYSYHADLELLRGYLADVEPVLIGVDGGADALIAAGYRPDLIVGDLELVSDDALRSGAEIVLRRSPDGRTPGMQRVAQLNLAAVAVTAAATAEDFALLLADAAGADLIVTVGAHAGLAEFLDQGRTAAGVVRPYPAQGRRDPGRRRDRRPAAPHPEPVHRPGPAGRRLRGHHRRRRARGRLRVDRTVHNGRSLGRPDVGAAETALTSPLGSGDPLTGPSYAASGSSCGSGGLVGPVGPPRPGPRGGGEQHHGGPAERHRRRVDRLVARHQQQGQPGQRGGEDGHRGRVRRIVAQDHQGDHPGDGEHQPTSTGNSSFSTTSMGHATPYESTTMNDSPAAPSTSPAIAPAGASAAGGPRPAGQQGDHQQRAQRGGEDSVHCG